MALFWNCFCDVLSSFCEKFIRLDLRTTCSRFRSDTFLLRITRNCLTNTNYFNSNELLMNEIRFTSLRLTQDSKGQLSKNQKTAIKHSHRIFVFNIDDDNDQVVL